MCLDLVWNYLLWYSALTLTRLPGRLDCLNLTVDWSSEDNLPIDDLDVTDEDLGETVNQPINCYTLGVGVLRKLRPCPGQWLGFIKPTVRSVEFAVHGIRILSGTTSVYLDIAGKLYRPYRSYLKRFLWLRLLQDVVIRHLTRKIPGIGIVSDLWSYIQQISRMLEVLSTSVN